MRKHFLARQAFHQVFTRDARQFDAHVAGRVADQSPRVAALRDGREVFDVKNERHLEYWISQPVDVYLVLRQQGEMSGDGTIRWMNVTRTLKNRKDKQSRQIVFEGHKLDMNEMWKVRDEFFPPAKTRK